LVAISLFKIQKFLRDGLRLRTACDLEVDMANGGVKVTRPVKGFSLPALDALESEIPELIKTASDHFAKPAVTEVKYTKA
jgi:CRISPR-associated protein Csb1